MAVSRDAQIRERNIYIFDSGRLVSIRTSRLKAIRSIAPARVCADSTKYNATVMSRRAEAVSKVTMRCVFVRDQYTRRAFMC